MRPTAIDVVLGVVRTIRTGAATPAISVGCNTGCSILAIRLIDSTHAHASCLHSCRQRERAHHQTHESTRSLVCDRRWKHCADFL